MSTNSVELVLHNGQTATEPIPVFVCDEIQPPPPPTSEAENKTEIVVANEEIKHQKHEQGSTHSSGSSTHSSCGSSTHSSGSSTHSCGFITHSLVSTDQSKEMRNILMIVATLFLQMSYQAGLNPPGGFWQDDPSTAAARSSAMTASSFAPAPLGGENGGDAVGPLPYQAGDPIMRSKNHSRYRQFEILNSVSLACSSVLIVILLVLSFDRCRPEVSPKASFIGLRAAVLIMYVDLMGILVAYNIGAVTPENRIISLIPYFAATLAWIVCLTLLKYSAAKRQVGKAAN